MICRLADLIIDFKNPSKTMQKLLKDYEFCAVPQFSIEVTPEEIEGERHITSTFIDTSQGEINAFLRKLVNLIPNYQALVIHASLIDVNDSGVAFLAQSGIGKTTHTFLWQKLLGKHMQIINGDKPIIRFCEGIPYGYGTPWCGKERLFKNAKVPIKHICFIERSNENSCNKITSKEALNFIFNQVFIPKQPESALKTLELLDKLLKSAKIWVIKCNTDISAAETAYSKIFKGEIL